MPVNPLNIQQLFDTFNAISQQFSPFYDTSTEEEEEMEMGRLGVEYSEEEQQQRKRLNLSEAHVHIPNPQEIPKYKEDTIVTTDSGDKFGVPKALDMRPIQTATEQAREPQQQSQQTDQGSQLPQEPQSQQAQPYRVSHWSEWKEQNPETYQRLLEETERVSKEKGVPQDLLMDIAGLETSGGQFMEQQGGPGRGPYQFEVDESGNLPSDVQNIARETGIEEFNPKDIGQSVELAGELVKRGQLSRWGTPQSSWGTLDNPRRKEGERLTDYYSQEELNKYLGEQHQF